MFTELFGSIGAIGTGIGGVIDAAQTINAAKPDTWQILGGIFAKITGLLQDIGPMLKELFSIFGA